MFDSMASSIEYIRAGKLRVLAVTTTGAPKSAPAAIVERLNKEINAALADPKMKSRLANFGGTVLAGSPADFGKVIADEIEKWAKVVKFSGARPD